MRLTENPQFAVVNLYESLPRMGAKPSSMQINLRLVSGMKPLKRRLRVEIQGGSQVIEVTENKAELERAIGQYKTIVKQCEAQGEIIQRNHQNVPIARVFLNAKGDIERRRIVQEQPGTPRV